MFRGKKRGKKCRGRAQFCMQMLCSQHGHQFCSACPLVALPHCPHFTGNYRRCTPFPVYCYGFRLCLCFGCDLSVGSLVGQLEINYERVGDNFVGFALRCAALLSHCAYDALHIAHKSHARLLQNCQFLTNFISLYTYIVV